MTALYVISPFEVNPQGILGPTLLFSSYSSISYEDVTGQPDLKPGVTPDPNFAVGKYVYEDAVAAAIAADPVWGPRILMEE